MPAESTSSRGEWTPRGSPGHHRKNQEHAPKTSRSSLHGRRGRRVHQGRPRRTRGVPDCFGRDGPTSSWSSPATRQGESMNSRAPSAGARSRTCLGITERLTLYRTDHRPGRVEPDFGRGDGLGNTRSLPAALADCRLLSSTELPACSLIPATQPTWPARSPSCSTTRLCAGKWESQGDAGSSRNSPGKP